MSDPFTGEIQIYGFNFAPYNWAMCQGQLMPIQQNTALFSLLGTTFGGNGTSNYQLPNFTGNANDFSAEPFTSANGDFVVFTSRATDMQTAVTDRNRHPHIHALVQTNSLRTPTRIQSRVL